MNFSLGRNLILGVLAATVALLVACQSTSPDPTPSTLTVTVPLSVSAVSRIPDSLGWHTASSSGSKAVQCAALSCPQEFELKTAMGAKDTLFVDVWKWGVLAGTAKFVSLNGSATLTSAGSAPNALGVNLLGSFSNFRASKDSLKNAKASDLVAYYAKLLLDSATTYPGTDIPTGMSSSAVKQAVVLLSSQRGLTSVQLQAKAILGLSTDSIRVYVSILVKASQLTDTTVLFPVSPLWIQNTVSVGDLTQGEGPVNVTGGFAWKKPRNITSAVVEVRNADGREDSVKKSFLNPLNPTDGSWTFTNNLTLQALMGAKAGTDTLVATLADDSGHTVTSRTTFKVLRGDTLAPSITVLNPPSDTTVDNATSSFVIRINATDNKAVAGVKIGSKSFSDAPYVDTVNLAVGGNVIVVEAWDASGNHSTKNVVIIRSKATSGGDTTKPVVKFVSPAADIDESFATSSLDLSWKASDEVGVTKVTLNDQTITSTSGTYLKTVALVVGANPFTIKAYDAAGNIDSQTIRITRLPDPAVVGIVPLADRAVVATQDTVILTWTLTNPQLASSISLDGVPLSLSGSTVTKTVSLASGANTFTLTVKDSSGKSISDTVVITRAADVTGPSIVWVTPTKSTTVDATTTSYKVQVKVTDPSGVDSVYLLGSLAKNDSGTYWSVTVPLPSPDGNPVVVRVQAWDKKKNVSSDTSLSITRSVPDGTDKPAITLIQPVSAAGNTLVFDSSVLNVQAKITDLVPVDPATVFFNNVAAKQQGDLYSADVPVPATGAPYTITIKASNTSKNGSTLDLAVTRAKDAVAPLITPSATTKSQTVPFDTKTFDLAWTISDNDSLATLKFNGSVVPTAGTLKTTVDLAVGADTFTLVAIDRAGNQSSSQVVLTRSQDAIPPVLTILSPATDTILSYGTTSILVKTQASDVGSGLKSVTVNGTLVDKNGAANVTLSGPNTVIQAIAEDNSGNRDTATVKATLMDITAMPTFSPIAGTYTSAQIVTIASATAGASIYYSTDGKDPTTASTLYAGTVTVSASETIKAIAVKTGITNSTVGSAIYTIQLPAETPTFSPIAGTYSAAQSVTITSATTGASIYYTTNGTDPTSASTLYSTPISVGATQTIKAIAVKTGNANSTVGTATYAIQLPAATPTFSPIAGTYTSTQSVTISSGTTGASIYYTTNGTDPTTSSTLYSTPIAVSASKTIKAIAVKTGSTNSAVGSAAYVIRAPAPAPTHSAQSGRYIGTVYDTLTSAGADSIQVSTDSALWTKSTGFEKVRTTGTVKLFAKAWPGGAITKVTLTINQIKQVKAASFGTWFVLDDGSAWSVGSNGNGQLGTGSTANEVSPVKIMDNVQSIATGAYHSLLLKTDGSLWAVGAGFSGVLCDGNSDVGVMTPKQVATGVTMIAAGPNTSYFMKSDNNVYSCGENTYGELVKGYTSASDLNPTPTLMSGVTGLSSGGGFCLFLKSDRLVRGAGNNSVGQLGLGDIVSDSTVQVVQGDAVSITSGMDHSAILLSDRTVVTIGSSYYGATGNGTTVDQKIPYKLTFTNGASAVSAGDYHTLFLTRDGVVYLSGFVVTSWGRGPSGTNYLSPTSIMTDVASISAGGYHSMAVKTDGTLWAFGWNDGTFGNGTTTSSETPVRINF